ncbi:MAG: IMP dehydrogenase, partial [Chlorobi bacterium]|nr:IMP dehydrogenase [Chlorobiota bacterium]
MSNEKIAYDGITFDDILLLPAKSNVLPREANIESRLTKNIKLNIPFLSAAMDTVTTSKMAIAMAAQGGMGIIHKNMSIAEQADEVDKVKRSESGMIHQPITLTAEKTIKDATDLMSKYHISGIPIVDNEHKLIGILTNRDLRFVSDLSMKVSEIMTKENLRTTAIGTSLEDAEKLLQKYRIEKLPVVKDDGTLVGLITFKDISKKKKYPLACKDELGRLRVGAGLGVTSDMMERVNALVKVQVDVVVVDTAHGHSEGVLTAVRKIKEKYPKLDVIAGNIVTGEAAKELIECGVDAVKVGIGAGSICTTRMVAGVGVPQISAVMEVYNAIKDTGIPIIADGGVKQTGDVPKA